MSRGMFASIDWSGSFPARGSTVIRSPIGRPACTHSRASKASRSVCAAAISGEVMPRQSVVQGPVLANRDRRAGLVLLASILLAGCAADVPPAKEVPVEADVPAPAAAPLSRFSVPLEYDVTAVLRL